MPEADQRRLIVGDIHGDWPNLRALLLTVGAIDEQGNRREGWWLLQLGDLIHGGGGESPRTIFRSDPGLSDERCLREGLRLFDVLLVGNHELPHAYPNAAFPMFAGQGSLSGECHHLLAEAVDTGRYRAACAVDGWLVTHAGLYPRLAKEANLPLDATTCADELNTRFARRVSAGTPDALFDAVGQKRGGSEPHGGIFWLDWDDLANARATNLRPQIVGHTPRPARPEQAGERLWCVDVGSALSRRVCALVKKGAAGEWQPIYYDERAH